MNAIARGLAAALIFAGAGLAAAALPTLKDLERAAQQLPKPQAPQAAVHISNDEAVQAMREALKTGIAAASKLLSKTDGYFGNELIKILLPPEAKSLMDNVGKIPQGRQMVDDVVLRLNRAAEEAAGQVVPIFVDAITSMTVADGLNIIKGDQTAATQYLQSKTRPALFKLFRPKVDAALSRPLVGKKSAKQAWEILVGAYNDVGAVANAGARTFGRPEPMPAIRVDLASYATDKGLDGLFWRVGEEEKLIRKNPFDYAAKIIQKVFGAALKGQL